jgi:hypothetical protein
VCAGLVALGLFVIVRAAIKSAQAQPPSQPAPLGDGSSALIEQLGALRDKGVLTEEEFQQKKADILSRM